jgi:hypothetical protein
MSSQITPIFFKKIKMCFKRGWCEYYCQDIGLVGDEKKPTNYDIKNVLPDC